MFFSFSFFLTLFPFPPLFQKTRETQIKTIANTFQQLKRQRSSDHNLNNTRQSPSLPAIASPILDDSPSPDSNLFAGTLLNSSIFSNAGVMSGDLSKSIIGSPMKKHRSSMLGSGSASDSNGNGVSSIMGLPAIDVMGQAERAGSASAGFGGNSGGVGAVDAMDDEEEL